MRSSAAVLKWTATRLIVIGAVLLTGSVAVFHSPSVGAAQTADDDLPRPEMAPTSTTATEYLVNGGMNGDYYPALPNHYVAPFWYRWWIDGTVLPEYDVTRDEKPYYEGDRAQRVHKWGSQWIAGLYQQVTGVTPCVNYQFTAVSRFDSVIGAVSHARIGLDPTGTALTNNTRTKGAISALPSLTVWSTELAQQFAWTQQSVVAEAYGDKITAITYGAPAPGSSGSTPQYTMYWDAASLIQVPFTDDRLPTPSSWVPSGFISVTNATADPGAGTVSIDWTTSGLASTQVWYAIYPPTTPVTATGSYSYSVYFPLIASYQPPTTYMTSLDTTPRLSHHDVIPDVPADQTVVFVALSRRPDGTACWTETSPIYQVTMSTGQMVALESARIPELLPEPAITR